MSKTPLYDNFHERLKAFLEPHGKSMEVAASIAKTYGTNLPSEKVRLSRILNRTGKMNAETLLYLQKLMDSEDSLGM